jgi:mRNA interferase RelE/StbE
LTYSLFIERQAQRALARIARTDQERIISAIRGLTDDPRPHGVKKLNGREAWRIRVGDYRVI